MLDLVACGRCIRSERKTAIVMCSILLTRVTITTLLTPAARSQLLDKKPLAAKVLLVNRTECAGYFASPDLNGAHRANKQNQ
jgi:hypothetical protein